MPPANGLQVKRPPSLREEVYQAIYAQLMSQKIPPGGRISVDNLVRELGVSQTPIREALSQLEARGLVVKTHLIGYCATDQLDRKRLEELYELRLLLEPTAAGNAAANITDEALQALDQLHAQMASISGPDARQRYSQFAIKDEAFHDAIADAGGNSLVREALARLHTHTHLFRLYFHATATKDALDEHVEILEAIRSRNKASAELAMRKHIEKSQARFVTFFED